MVRPSGGSHLRSLSLRARVCHPNTRVDVRLLGPCFKTGRVGHRPFARRERVCPSATRPSQGSQDTRGFPLRPRKRRRRGTNPPGPSTSPATGRGDLHHEGKYARRRRLGRGHAQGFLGRISESRRPASFGRRAESPRFDLRGPTRLALNGFTYS